MMTTQANKVTVMGVSDEITTCECCGRAGLKRTVALRFESGDIRNYGCDCAAKALTFGSRRAKASHILDLAKWRNLYNTNPTRAARLGYYAHNFDLVQVGA